MNNNTRRVRQLNNRDYLRRLAVNNANTARQIIEDHNRRVRTARVLEWIEFIITAVIAAAVTAWMISK
jgi:hypothetical protein